MKKKKKKRAQLPFRLNILFFVVFLFFSILIIQLGIVQILNGETYQGKIDQTEQETVKIPVPRGKIYDSYHNIIVDNKPLYSITYTPPKGIQAKEKLKLAKTLSKYITMLDVDGKLPYLTERNKQEYWYLENEEEALTRLTDEEKKELDAGEQYNKILNRITEEELNMLSDKELEIIAIKRELDRAYSLAPQIVKNEGITTEEYARVAEHLDELKGINATIDWVRVRPYGETFGAFIGSITEGILADKEQFYLTRGYSRNDRVGRSGLEEQYEEILRGRKEEIEYTTDKNGNVVDSQVIIQGERGKDLILTVDMEYQERIDDLVRKELDAAIKTHPYENRLLEDAIVVVMQPKTGEILAISGQHYNREDDTYESRPLKALHDIHVPGSSIKGATVLAGYQSGVISHGQVFNDKPMEIAETPLISSVGRSSFGLVNDLDALERSSNIYMAYIALRMGGIYDYTPNMRLSSFNYNAFQEMRNYFAQLGLGVKTGIDFPNESSGLIGQQSQGGELIFNAFGQYDNYTTLQLAQYVSTIANDGTRVRPHLLKEIRQPSLTDELGPLYRSINPEVLNQVQMDISHIERVQEGFYRAYHGARGTASGTFKDKPYNPAGKTGTAESKKKDNDEESVNTINQVLVGYAPFEEPEIAFAVMVPHMGSGFSQASVSQAIGEGVLDTYFDLKKEREEGGNKKDSDDEKEDNELEEPLE